MHYSVYGLGWVVAVAILIRLRSPDLPQLQPHDAMSRTAWRCRVGWLVCDID